MPSWCHSPLLNWPCCSTNQWDHPVFDGQGSCWCDWVASCTWLRCSFMTGSNCAISSTFLRKFPFDREYSVSVSPPSAIFQTARDCTIAVRHVNTSLQLIFSASISAISCLSIVSPFMILIAYSFHVKCSRVLSCEVSTELACFQSVSPELC